MNTSFKLPGTVEWKNGELYFLDQTLLPLEIISEKQENAEQVWDSIKRLKVRGAPAIGIAGAYGLAVGMRNKLRLSADGFLKELARCAEYLNSSRPTAVNLSWALKRIVGRVSESGLDSAEAMYRLLVTEAELIHAEDRAICEGIGRHGAGLIKEEAGVLTHCNAGSLATSGIGTATAPMYTAHAEGRRFRVFSDETRPLLQGARLTSWELQRAGLDVTLICDNMAASVMAKGWINLVIVGTDRVTANGDVANKIGTLGVAVMAKHFGIPFYVACPSSTVDLATACGADIEIEERDAEEVTSFGERRTAPENIKVCNPAFDVTPNELITGIITEKGIIKAPYGETLVRLFGK
ncbi:S-methyl-5-thioribose-1-phosphate isomerase [Geovibrio thiophilus]|uniref:Methylthioribose-1-phosphate isomerase n=1 Tax=Geovibrio thiophilus TaxID=139438 RepID=A0A410JYA4_9BACT|nr:S-methyl-5-thioribose-1-phosphate isomerase [Geovibrio thiophilus]QAR33147.1 S-methyl-5-thioribose-1-phosphate isomerase [Geovibrio thiophilus]